MNNDTVNNIYVKEDQYQIDLKEKIKSYYIDSINIKPDYYINIIKLIHINSINSINSVNINNNINIDGQIINKQTCLLEYNNSINYYGVQQQKYYY